MTRGDQLTFISCINCVWRSACHFLPIMAAKRCRGLRFTYGFLYLDFLKDFLQYLQGVSVCAGSLWNVAASWPVAQMPVAAICVCTVACFVTKQHMHTWQIAYRIVTCDAVEVKLWKRVKKRSAILAPWFGFCLVQKWSLVLSWNLARKQTLERAMPFLLHFCVFML